MITKMDYNNILQYESMCSIILFQNHPQVKSFKRSAYNGLDLLGDIGGLYDGLRLVFESFLTALSGIDYTSLLISKLFLVGTSITSLKQNSLRP